ncbi:MAG: hypothetical protein QOJ29_2230 [Thermoleophilaceae bacterium]|jgi:hypothetical protein|nr:hypothetical protein [Thermoleophilaceae bacterium]
MTAVLLLVIGVAGTSQAIVPPKNCGTITVKHHRYNVKADQLPCSQAKTYASRYLGAGTRPPSYTCHHYKGSALVARCENTRANPDRTIFMIKR